MQSFPWETLLEWYKKNGRHPLPWRNYTLADDIIPYRIWISEIFLQQTQASRVIEYFEKVLHKFPTIESLANTDYETFFPYYQGLGYYSRARNMLKTAQILGENYGGIIPKKRDELGKLPGVGPYTASAILAFGYGEPYLAWDTNLEKVFSRYYKGRKDIRLTQEEKAVIENDFQDFVEGMKNYELRITNVRNINNALMDFAALADLKNPLIIDWENYPIQSGVFYSNRGSLEPNEVKKSVSFPLPDATIIVILHRDHKVYYSSLENEYTPFFLPPPLHRDSRKYVQEYFRSEHKLELSVRPIHKKWIDSDGRPFALVNAQIQTGTHHFHEFQKKDYLSFFQMI